MKKTSLAIIFIAVLSVLPVVIFYVLYAKRHSQISYPFKRVSPYKLQGIKRMDIKYNSYYFAGIENGDLYLGNSTSPTHLLKIDSSLKGSASLQIKIGSSYPYGHGDYLAKLDSPYVYLYNGAERAVMRGNKSQVSLLTLKVPFFQDFIPLDSGTFVCRYVSFTTKNNSFRKISAHSRLLENDTVLNRQVDGRFCTAGMLTNHPTLKKITYTYFFRNQILLLDTNLRLIKTIKTIDPIDSARFTVSEIASNNQKVLTSPSLLVNSRVAAWKQFLFVNSAIMSQNDDEVKFKNYAVIDIYNLNTYSYMYSIYLPNQDKNPISAFYVAYNSIYTLSGHSIFRYTIKLPVEVKDRIYPL